MSLPEEMVLLFCDKTRGNEIQILAALKDLSQVSINVFARRDGPVIL